MKELRVLTLCGAGVGTSMLLEMNVEAAFKALKLPFKVKVDHSSISRVGNKKVDLIVTFPTFEKEARAISENVILIKNIMDKTELQTKISEFIENANILGQMEE